MDSGTDLAPNPALGTSYNLAPHQTGFCSSLIYQGGPPEPPHTRTSAAHRMQILSAAVPKVPQEGSLEGIKQETTQN